MPPWTEHRQPAGALLQELHRAAQTTTDECITLRSERRPKVHFNGKYMNASRAVWIIAKGDPGDLFVLHGPCNDDWCINIQHLYLGTAGDNMRDKTERGTQRPGRSPGEKNGRAKLTLDDVEMIRSSTEPGTELAKRLGVGKSAVSRVRLGRSWAGVSRCRSCKAPIIWAETQASAKKAGKRIPLDTDPQNPALAARYSDGNIMFVGTRTGDGTPIVRVTRPGPNKARTHFSSCPNAGRHRLS